MLNARKSQGRTGVRDESGGSPMLLEFYLFTYWNYILFIYLFKLNKCSQEVGYKTDGQKANKYGERYWTVTSKKRNTMIISRRDHSNTTRPLEDSLIVGELTFKNFAKVL